MKTNYLNASKEGGIYEIRNENSNQIYIGSTNCFRKRYSEHKRLLRNNQHSNIHLQRAWNKCGEASFTFKVLLVLEPLELDQRLLYEQKYLNQYWKLGVLYNMVPLSESKDLLVSGHGRKKNEEERRKISQAMKGKRRYKQKNWTVQVQALVDAFRNDTKLPDINSLSKEEQQQCREAYDKWTRGGEYANDHTRRKKSFKEWLSEKNYFFDKRQDSWTRKSAANQLAATEILKKYRMNNKQKENKAVKRV